MRWLVCVCLSLAAACSADSSPDRSNSSVTANDPKRHSLDGLKAPTTGPVQLADAQDAGTDPLPTDVGMAGSPGPAPSEVERKSDASTATAATDGGSLAPQDAGASDAGNSDAGVAQEDASSLPPVQAGFVGTWAFSFVQSSNTSTTRSDDTMVIADDYSAKLHVVSTYTGPNSTAFGDGGTSTTTSTGDYDCTGSLVDAVLSIKCLSTYKLTSLSPTQLHVEKYSASDNSLVSTATATRQ